jgi:Uma2 family endonuclease
VSTSTLVPLAEYLNTTYRPDCDFLEGELKERNMGEQSHARVQLIIAKIFDTHRKSWDVRTSPELRVQVSVERFRVPDICVLHRSDAFEEIVRKAPLLCIEILSSGDSLRSLQERVNDYAAMGVPNIWAVDPWGRAGYYASPRGFVQPEDGMLRILNTPIAISLAEVFAELDEN